MNDYSPYDAPPGTYRTLQLDYTRDQETQLINMIVQLMEGYEEPARKRAASYIFERYSIETKATPPTDTFGR